MVLLVLYLQFSVQCFVDYYIPFCPFQLGHCIFCSSSNYDLWDNYGTCHSNKSEKLQLEAAIIVTRLPIFTKTDSVYFETIWEPLHTRHHRRKLQLFYKIYKGLAPQYLHHLILPTIQSTTIYPLRNGSDLTVPFCRLSSTNSVREWNKLENSVHNLDTPLNSNLRY